MRLKPEPCLSPEEYDALSRIDLHTLVQRVFVELTGKPFLDNWHDRRRHRGAARVSHRQLLMGGSARAH